MMSREESERILYGGTDPLNKPRYAITKAARYLGIPSSTLRSWIRGRHYPKAGGRDFSKPLIKASDRLSFANLIEAHVLWALRVEPHVQMSAVRTALRFAEREFSVKRLLLSEKLLSAPGEIFLERYGELINLGRSGQLAMKHLLEAYLRRVDWDAVGNPERLFPTGPVDRLPDLLPPDIAVLPANIHKIIVIDPRVSFGQPIVASRSIRTSSIVSRIDAGEEIEAVAEDYNLERYEVEAAIFYEKAA